MTEVNFESETWDFVNATGELRRIDVTPTAPLAFPTQWRVFGKLGPQSTAIKLLSATPLADLNLQGLTGLPDSLTVDGQQLAGRDVQMQENTINFDGLFNGHNLVEGHQAFAMSQVECGKETEIILGAGADYWMQWWIDGQPVIDTCKSGNLSPLPTIRDFSARHKLSPGRHILAVRVISGTTGDWILRAAFLSPKEESLGQAPQNTWLIVPELNQLASPRGMGDRTIAIRTDQVYQDETIECEFDLMRDEGQYGIVFAAQDADHYYWAYIPRWGQLWRARAFYAAIGIADGSGYIRNLAMYLMPNVPQQLRRRISLKIERRGHQIQMWVDAVRGPMVIDDTYGPGRIGVSGFIDYRIYDLKVTGKSLPVSQWKTSDHLPQTWFTAEQDTDKGAIQTASAIFRLPDGRLATQLGFTNKPSVHDVRPHTDDAYIQRYASEDLGRTWQPYGPQADWPGYTPPSGILTKDRVLRGISFPAVYPPNQFHDDPLSEGCTPQNLKATYCDSPDDSLNWSKPVEAQLLGDWSHIFFENCWNNMYGFSQFSDGTLAGVILHGTPGNEDSVPNYGQGTWGGGGLAQPYCTLSKDDGKSWSQPVPMDDAVWRAGDKPDSHCGGFSECPIVRCGSGRIVAIARPYRAPFMWQTHSDDDGVTWRMVCYAPFSGAGGPVMLCTQSNYLVLAMRSAGTCMHISTDEGLNWDHGTILDHPTYFNGSMIEVEPDVVLINYPTCNGEIARPSYVRFQRIRITPDGPIPLSD